MNEQERKLTSHTRSDSRSAQTRERVPLCRRCRGGRKETSETQKNFNPLQSKTEWQLQELGVCFFSTCVDCGLLHNPRTDWRPDWLPAMYSHTQLAMAWSSDGPWMLPSLPWLSPHRVVCRGRPIFLRWWESSPCSLQSVRIHALRLHSFTYT